MSSLIKQVISERERLKRLIIRHEGIRLKLYRDSVGIWSIGVGRNLQANGIKHSEAMVLLNNDINQAFSDLEAVFPHFYKMSVVRQHALVDMMFNLGLVNFNTFEHFIKAIKIEDYPIAALEMLDSKWARQVGVRSKELAEMIHLGTYPSGV
jgi:lysozyme